MNFLQYLKNNIVYLDGGMGTLLQQRGLKAGEHPERWNISHPDVISDIHTEYFNAGSNVVCTNTFGANLLNFDADELERIIEAAINNARAAMLKSSNCEPKFVALDIGPSGKLLKPFGDLDFEEAVSIFANTVRLGVKYGADLILIETMNDSYETKAALLAAKENSNLPVIVSNAYGEDGKLMTGATPEAMVAMLEGMGADAIGANCSLGPDKLAGVARTLIKNASVPVLLKPNAGLPKAINGKTVFDIAPEEFADTVSQLVQEGLRVAGGCCGTTPQYIKALVDKSKNIKCQEITAKNITVVSSYASAVEIGNTPVLIGERINPTGKKRFKQALMENDMDYILSEGVQQQSRSVHILDVNVGLPGIDETDMLKRTVCELQAVIDIPLQIDTSSVQAMEAAMRVYNGKAMINSVNGKKESMEAVFPLVKKYGGVVVALTLDENGIPSTAQGRVDIAKRILQAAQEFGIDKKDIVFDTLAMTVSADNSAARVTIEAIRRIKHELGCNTSLGVSNVSFGLPNREALNSIFFAMALENGLSAAIMNPYSADMLKTYYSFRALNGADENCLDYIENADTFTSVSVASSNKQVQEQTTQDQLQYAVIKGLKDKAAELTKQMLGTVPPLDIVNHHIIPALNTVGVGFENKTVYLPQLLMSAEAAQKAFESIKAYMSDGAKGEKATFVIATVQGDIHDIGKNIVKLLLENYGFKVVDLGKDVAPEVITQKVVELKAPLLGLSALMTTTVPSMEKTIAMVKAQAPWCKTVVGGAVLTKDYADRIGADAYAKDAMETVRFAEDAIR